MSPTGFGDLLKAYRKRAKLTQRQVATKLDVHYNTIWAWERGDHLPDTRGMVLELARHLRLSDEETRRLLEASLTALSPYWSVPYQRNRFFTGRDKVLALVQSLLCQHQAAALTQSLALSGLGGVGKSQTALEYAYAHAQEYSAIFWVAAETSETLLASCTAIVELLQGARRHEYEHTKIIATVSQWLANHRDWLLIVDNVEDIELVKPLLPAARHGAILFTTRMQALGTLAHPVELQPMNVEEGTRLLLHRTRQFAPEGISNSITSPDLQVATSIVEMLGGLPLAIDQAGAYIEETRCRLADYLHLYQTAPFPLLGERGIHIDHPASVFRTFALTFEKLQQRNPAAAELLQACAYLAPDAIPEFLLLNEDPCLGPTLQALAADPLRYHAAIKDLLTYSLIRLHTETRTLSIHRLVQAVLKEIMPPETQKVWAGRVFQALNHLFPSERLTSLSLEEWTRCRQLLPHAIVSESLSEQRGDTFPDASEFLMKIANYLRDQARYGEAEPLYARAIALCEENLGSNHPALAKNLMHQGVLYEYQGMDKLAEALHLRATSICEEVLGPTHPDTAQCLLTLAALYHYQGRYQEEEALYQRTLSICEEVLGPTHADTVQSINNLAVLYGVQGRYAEAEPLFVRALSIREQLLGPAHPGIAASLNNLATLYRKQGKYAEAEPLLLRALSVCERELGPVHPHTANCLNSLAVLYRSQGRHQQAEPLLLKALSIREQHVGLAHPDTAQSLYDVAIFSREQGKEEQAVQYLQRALPVAQQALGAEHPLTQQITQALDRRTQ